jgi:hypothetical protein
VTKEAPLKRLLAAAVTAAVVVGVAAAPAAAATPTQRLAKLERQVRTLQRQNRTLTRQVREAREIGIAAAQVAVCSTAISADAFQATWSVIDQIAQPTLNRTFFGGQVPVQDPICSQLQVSRPQPVPPTVSPFASLLRFFNQPNSALSAVFH